MNAPPKFCDDPSCRCHIKNPAGQGWRFGSDSHMRAGSAASCGTVTRYNAGCRCRQCKTAKRESRS